ncbi:MAG TPA: response regulator, partial [Candidatus Dormibacteraeota bacterium]|nr:response regulator [Candidatus Dormibacteraeota bacterium]
MREPPLILVVDDVADNAEILQMRLESRGYAVITAGDGEAALAAIRNELPDLVLLDIMMPKLDGIETVKAMKADAALPFIPVILVTARADATDVIAGLEAGGDDYLTKPVDQAALMARVKAMLRIKALHDERIGLLKRFLAPQLAELIASSRDARILETHRRDIVVAFCDIRGFTSFAETGEPEDVHELLHEYHATVGPIVTRSEGTLDHFAGDGIMVFFNDPFPCPNPAERAVRMAIEMRDAVAHLQGEWRRRGLDIGFGIGVAQGYATLGQIGFAERI